MARHHQARALEREARALEAEKKWRSAADVWDVAGDAWAEAGDEKRSRYTYEQAWGRRQHGGDWFAVRAIFRRYPLSNGGEVIALLPDHEWAPNQVTLFSAEGGHGGAPYHLLIDATRPANPPEYAPLARQMRALGYDVTPILRYSPRRS